MSVEVDRVKTAVLTSLLVVTLLPACGSTKAPREPAADTEPSYVLVDSGARFYQSPQADAPRQSGSMHPRTGDALTPRSVPVRYEWVADHEGWVEVRPTASEPAHCVGPSRQLQDFDLRLFVKRSALVPVLTATVTVTQPNGTEAAALAGRWLRPGQDEVVETNKRSKVPVAAVRVPLPASAIGFRYQGGALRPTLADWTYYLGPDAIFATDWEPESGFTGDVISVTAGEDADTVVATIRRRCVETTRPVKRRGARDQAGPSARRARLLRFG